MSFWEAMMIKVTDGKYNTLDFKAMMSVFSHFCALLNSVFPKNIKKFNFKIYMFVEKNKVRKNF